MSQTLFPQQEAAPPIRAILLEIKPRRIKIETELGLESSYLR